MRSFEILIQNDGLTYFIPLKANVQLHHASGRDYRDHDYRDHDYRDHDYRDRDYRDYDYRDHNDEYPEHHRGRFNHQHRGRGRG